MVDFLTLSLQGLFTGIGVAVGTWFANSEIIKHLENMKGENGNGGVKEWFLKRLGLRK
jgi:hypothetical protein